MQSNLIIKDYGEKDNILDSAMFFQNKDIYNHKDDGIA